MFNNQKKQKSKGKLDQASKRVGGNQRCLLTSLQDCMARTIFCLTVISASFRPRFCRPSSFKIQQKHVRNCDENRGKSHATWMLSQTLKRYYEERLRDVTIIPSTSKQKLSEQETLAWRTSRPRSSKASKMKTSSPGHLLCVNTLIKKPLVSCASTFTSYIYIWSCFKSN